MGHAKVIEIGKSPRAFGRIAEEREAIAHEVRERVLHLERGAQRRPDPVVEAVEESGGVRAVPKIAFGLQVDEVLGDRDFLDLDGGTRVGVDHHEGPGFALRFHTHEPVALLQQGEPCEVAVLQVGDIEGDFPRALRADGPLSERIAVLGAVGVSP